MNVFMRIFMGLPLVFILLLANGCEAVWPFGNQKLGNKEVRDLKIAALRHPLAVQGPEHSGFEGDMLAQFARDRGYRISWQVMDSPAAVANAVQSGKSDLGAARFNVALSVDGVY